MRSVQEDQLIEQTPQRTESRIAEGLFATHETVEGVRDQGSDPEILQPGEYRTLMAQCWILVMIASIVAWLIAA